MQTACDDEHYDDGHRHGNFKHYYEFHNSTRERFKGIAERSFYQLWQELGAPLEFSILDIGCNEGNLTAELLQLVQSELPPHVVCTACGIDFDKSLIDVALQRYEATPNLHFFVVNVMESNSWESFVVNHQEYLKSLCVVSCLRVSMWIHLNEGDAGLLHLFHLLGNAAATSSLLLDPQKLSYYKKTCTRNTKLNRPSFPYSLEDLSLLGYDLPSYCLKFFDEKYKLSKRLHNDITKWGGTLLFLMYKASTEEKDDIKV